MGKLKKFSIILSSILVLATGGYAFIDWIINETMNLNAIFAGCLSIAFLFNSLTWGDMQGEKGKDELDLHIKTQSAKIGYFILIGLCLLILIISEGAVNFNEINNVPLVLVVFLAFIILPVTEFFYSKKFK